MKGRLLYCAAGLMALAACSSNSQKFDFSSNIDANGANRKIYVAAAENNLWNNNARKSMEQIFAANGWKVLDSQSPNAYYATVGYQRTQWVVENNQPLKAKVQAVSIDPNSSDPIKKETVKIKGSRDVMSNDYRTCFLVNIYKNPAEAAKGKKALYHSNLCTDAVISDEDMTLYTNKIYGNHMVFNSAGQTFVCKRMSDASPSCSLAEQE